MAICSLAVHAPWECTGEGVNLRLPLTLVENLFILIECVNSYTVSTAK